MGVRCIRHIHRCIHLNRLHHQPTYYRMTVTHTHQGGKNLLPILLYLHLR